MDLAGPEAEAASARARREWRRDGSASAMTARTSATAARLSANVMGVPSPVGAGRTARAALRETRRSGPGGETNTPIAAEELEHVVERDLAGLDADPPAHVLVDEESLAGEQVQDEEHVGEVHVAQAQGEGAAGRRHAARGATLTRRGSGAR